MKQAKKIITAMCLNNWGGVAHKILAFHEYVNLFSGKSGSGKSTVMDAIQVILYGSFSSSFLNRAADDSKNKRSVLNYLRGEQKDGTANRENMDFCSTIVMEIKDTGTQTYTCMGIAFEVKKNDAEIKKYLYFSHAGQMPQNGYLTEQGHAYTNQDIRKLVEERALLQENQGKDVNRIYPSKEAYLNAVYDIILGYIDGKRFQIMEKSAIALKMTNGTGQFIKDYMFPKSESNAIEKISEQLGAYQDIQNKIKDMRKRIELLTKVKEAGDERLAVQTDIVRTNALLQCIDVLDLRTKLAVYEEDNHQNEEALTRLEAAREQIEEQLALLNEEYINILAELKSSDLGAKQTHLKSLEISEGHLLTDTKQWKRVVAGLMKWEEDEAVTDYVSNPMLNRIQEFCKGKITEQLCEELHRNIQDTREILEDIVEEYNEQRRETERELAELRTLVDDMRNDRKPFPPSVKEARTALERKLSDQYGRTIKVSILADLFDVRDKEWKNAIEGRMGRLKLSLVTEPAYAHDAAVIFREMKQYEEVELVNTKAIADSGAKAEEGSLYEAVETSFPYVDACLKRYLGRIRKCRSIEELEQVRDGVTPDCYSYSNFIFRHLRKKDYDRFACIGSKVSKAKLEEYVLNLEKLEARNQEQKEVIRRLKAAADFEQLSADTADYVRLSQAQRELSKTQKNMETLRQEIALLREGRFKELESEKERIERRKNDKEQSLRENQNMTKDYERKKGLAEGDIRRTKEILEEKEQGYQANAEIEAETEELLKVRSGQTVKKQKQAQLEILLQKEQETQEKLQTERNRFNREYPGIGFHGMEKDNDGYVRLLEDYQRDYEPKYEQEFEKQCSQIYHSLRENVIATIHGDINAAKRHTHEINRLLRKTNFADSTYQIKIEPAKNENGQFYEMLTAQELDSKNISSNLTQGQLSLGEDEFYQKYEQKIKMLTDKFMPPREEDASRREQRLKEMEQFADYRNYLSFSMFEQVTDDTGKVIRENFVDEMAGRDSGGEGQNPKYVALLAGFAMLYMQQSNRDSKIKLVLLDEAFSKMDQERSAVCLKYARRMELQLIVCVPDERLQSLIQNVDCVYGFRRQNNRITMMHIDKGDYLKLMEGEERDEDSEEHDSGDLDS